uniref:Uncharacterized protein n=1 Tax=Arundo donax TaxID=35708 RepID=A0A0A9AB06_ARUDO
MQYTIGGVLHIYRTVLSLL